MALDSEYQCLQQHMQTMNIAASGYKQTEPLVSEPAFEKKCNPKVSKLLNLTTEVCVSLTT